MTTYGRGGIHVSQGRFIIEIQSVNRKHLDVLTMLPREFVFLDVELKKWLAAFVARGQVTIKLTAFIEGLPPFNIKPNLVLAHQLKLAWDQIAESLQSEDKFELSLLQKTEGLLNFEENREQEGIYRDLIRACFDEALKGFMLMKKNEGMALELDIRDRLKKMREVMQRIESKSSNATLRYREKLVERLEELLPGKVENEERILREVALYAEKIDIAEEITRFNCHLGHFEEVMKSTEISVGKTLDFIVQELNREVNTVGSKSSDMEIARSVIEIKSELERIREQIQNIE
jgi:uncharacterized protein (TIGR00255 family)